MDSGSFKNLSRFNCSGKAYLDHQYAINSAKFPKTPLVVAVCSHMFMFMYMHVYVHSTCCAPVVELDVGVCQWVVLEAHQMQIEDGRKADKYHTFLGLLSSRKKNILL